MTVSPTATVVPPLGTFNEMLVTALGTLEAAEVVGAVEAAEVVGAVEAADVVGDVDAFGAIVAGFKAVHPR